MKTVLIIGDSMKAQREKIIELGYDYVQLRDIQRCKHPEKRFKKRVVCDFSNDSLIDEAIVRLNKRYKVDGVVCTYENYILATSYIAKSLNLRGMPLEAAMACTDKSLMREKFAKAPLKISPDYKEVISWDDVISFMKNHQYPVILKPANLAKSLLVTKNSNEKELRTSFSNMVQNIDKIYKKYAPNRHPKILIEEFMVGSVHSVDAFVDEYGTPHILENVVDYQTGYEIGYDDNFHYSRILPSSLSKDDISNIMNVAKIGCKSLGMKSSPAHIEIIKTQQGPMVVEIGARNGGYRERMHILANGIDITKNALALCVGEKIDILPKINNYCAVLELFPKNPGIFNGVKNETELLKLSSLNYYALKQNIGSYVGKSSEGYKMCAIIILHNSDKIKFEQDLQFVDKDVAIDVC